MSTPAQAGPAAIGSYRITGHLGQGDFAVVYRAKKAGDEYAIKVAHENSTEARIRLRLEAEALRLLDHQAIPKYVEALVFEERPCVVMELVPGQQLKEHIRSRANWGAVCGDVEALAYITELLGGLAHIHSQKLVHRDIKDANLIAVDPEARRLKIIDFGFCKIEGRDEIRLSDSFFRAGAIRYSPPAKIERPEHAVANHDVFAAGVIGYQLLTGRHPWTVGSDQGIGAYREALTRPATPVTELNPRVDRSIGQFVMALLEQDDAHRPESAAAHEDAVRLLRAVSNRPVLKATWPTSAIQFPHVTRDNLYGDVRLTDDEWKVLGTPEMQRLRWIKQLGLTNLVYTGAEHTRLAHAIGSVHRVEQILSSIENIEGVRIDSETRLIARLYALVHDVTHVAYGHTVEDELGLFPRHDSNQSRTERLLTGATSQLGQTLRSTVFGSAVLSHYDMDATIQRRSSVLDLVSSSTGADVLDYIDRDATHCGLDHHVDSAIFRQFRLAPLRSAPTDSRLVSLLFGAHGVRLDREFAVQSLLNERYAMFMKVYTHRAKIAASALLGKALVAARSSSGISEAEYEWMSDIGVLERLKQFEDPLAKASAERLLRRELPRAVYRANLLSEDEQVHDQYLARQNDLAGKGLFSFIERKKIEDALGLAARMDGADVIVYCPEKAPGYQRVEHWISARPGSTHALDSVKRPYRSIQAKHLGLWELWVFSMAESRKDALLGRAAIERFGFENRLGVDRRMDRAV